MTTGFVDRAKGKTAINTQFMSQGAQFFVNFQDNITALVGGSQATAPLLAQQQSRITTSTASGTDAVRLPPAIGGASVVVLNDTANTCSVYPSSATQGGVSGGDKINAGAANALYALLTGVTNGPIIFYCFTTGVWRTK